MTFGKLNMNQKNGCVSSRFRHIFYMQMDNQLKLSAHNRIHTDPKQVRGLTDA